MQVIDIRTHRATLRDLPGCIGSCNQGRTACDTELCNSVAPREEFPVPRDWRVRRNFWAAYASGLLIALMSALLACWPK